MSVSLIIFIIIHVLAFAFCAETMRRIAMKHREYPLEDTERTLPFGFLKLRYVLIFYIGSYLLWILFSIWLYTVFINPDGLSIFNNSQPTPDVILNL